MASEPTWWAKLKNGLTQHPLAISRRDATRYVAIGLNKLWEGLASILLAGILGLTGWFFLDFLGPRSIWFWLAIADVVFVLGFFKSKYYWTAALAFVALFAFVPIISLSASIYIASDQNHLRYRTVDGIAYLEFPGQIAALKSVAAYRSAAQVIEIVDACGEPKVAKLPLLTYKPISPQKGIIDAPFAFRRFPNLRFEGFELNVLASTGTATQPGGELKHSAGLRLGFRSNEPAEISLTDVFPRSVDCIDKQGVPLLPILEILPWNPNDPDSLIEAFARTKELRRIYPNDVLSFEKLFELRMPDNSGQSKALFDFLIYFLEYQAFAGNAFADIRADYGNKLCVLLEGRQEAFRGPFAAFKNNFLRQIVAEYGPHYRTVYPACDVPDTLLRNYQSVRERREPLPYMATFRNCLATAGSIKECLAKDDAPIDEKNCAADSCLAKPPEVTLFELYDSKFAEIVANDNNTLVETRTIRPDKCPRLRDSEEDSAFILWWLHHANMILSKPVMCSSPAWQADLSRSLDEEKKTLSCASERGVQNVQDPLGVPSALSLVAPMRCGTTMEINPAIIFKTWYFFSDQSEQLSITLRKHRAYIGSRKADAIISALEMFSKIKSAICGTLDKKSCLDQYLLWQDYWRVPNQLTAIVDPSFLNGTIRENIDKLTQLDNVLLEMGICDLLQDEIVREKSGYNRETYCDEHGLNIYRLTRSTGLGQSIERTDTSSGDRYYSYESEEFGRDALIKIPYGNP
jgi:hypothetical protein